MTLILPWIESLHQTRHGTVALTRWRLAHSRRPDGYWVTRAQACGILGVHRARVGQLVEACLVPYARARTVRRQIVFRRDQLQVVAQARHARFRIRSPGTDWGQPAERPLTSPAEGRTDGPVAGC